MVTNTTFVFRGMVLQIGLPYTFYVTVLDANGVHCRGDSQDDATELTIQAVTNELVPRVSTQIQVINVNVTESTSAAFTRQTTIVTPSSTPSIPTTPDRFAPPAAIPARNTVKAIGGGFAFHVVFSNSTLALGLNGIRVRVTAQSATPQITGTRAEALSGAVDTVIAATQLRFRPDTQPSRYVVVGRDFKNNASGTFVIQAVDNLDVSWTMTQPALLTSAPNIARRPTERGNNAAVQWNIEPLVDGTFPISFRTGAQATTLTAGEASFSGLQWTGRDGDFVITVQAQNSKEIQATRPYLVTMQKPVKLLLNTTNFNAASGISCTNDCILPNNTFTHRPANGTNGEFLNTTTLRPVNLTVFVADSQNRAVLGDDESVIELTLENPSPRTSVRLAQPDAYTTTAPFYARVRGGRATFFVGFIGSTEEAAGNHTRVRLVFSCPATIPVALRRAGESIVNPCAAPTATPLTPLRSLPIQIGDTRPPAEVFTSAEVLSASPIVKIPTGITSVDNFNVTDFVNMLASKLAAAGFGYISIANAGSVLRVTACEVDRTVFGTNADLGTSVCGATNKCSGPNPTQCPNGVVRCICPSSTARAMLLNRFLLQTSGTGREVQAEVQFQLEKAVGFTGTNVRDIIAAYQALGAAATNILRNDPEMAAAFAIDTQNVGVTNVNAPPVTAPPTATPAPTAGPTTTNAPPAVPDTASSTVSVMFAVMIALLFSLLM
jgi:hypothetical protein